MEQAQLKAELQGSQLESGLSLEDAANGSHVIYARSWWGLEDYGQPSLSAHRSSRSGGWCVDDRIMDAGEDTPLMHPMPIRRNLEVTDRVLDGPRSLIIDQAANRLHTQKSLLSLLLRP